MNETIAVVGAGMAGLLLAGALKAQGAEVIVFEKSRGLGGRLATKRVGEATFDSGAQYFTAKSERFAGLVSQCQSDTRGAVPSFVAGEKRSLRTRQPDGPARVARRESCYRGPAAS